MIKNFNKEKYGHNPQKKNKIADTRILLKIK